MTARRSSSDPVSLYLKTGERIVWRHQPSVRALVFNRLPTVIIIVLLTAFLAVIAFNVIGNTLVGGFELAPWLILPAAVALFFAVLFYFFLSTLWNHTRYLLDSWDTHYGLTDRRFIIVSGRGITEYDASYFKIMEPLGGETGTQVLAFDWRIGRRGRKHFHDRIAALPDSAKLAQLIRATLDP